MNHRHGMTSTRYQQAPHADAGIAHRHRRTSARHLQAPHTDAGSAHRHRRTRAGFSLVELSIVLVIIGILVSIGAQMLPGLLGASKVELDRAIQNRFRDAVIGYVIANNRLPCAADSGAALGTAARGVENCDEGTPHYGLLPFRTLGLPDGNDAYGRQMYYGVYRNTGAIADLSAPPAPPGGRTGLCTALENAFFFGISSNFLHIGRSPTNGGGAVTDEANVAFAIVSGGFENLDGEDDFRDLRNRTATNAAPGIEHPGTTRATHPNYDDLVLVVSFNELIGRLCAPS